MVNSEIIQLINNELAIELPEKISPEDLKEELSICINNMISSDFQILVSLLYRVDINENKLKHLLKENPGEDAGKIIAELIIERQKQKIKSRQEFNQQDKNIDDEEKW